jgi:hypothetical protein
MAQIIVNEDGYLVQPSLHDAKIERIDFLGKEVSFYFRTTDAKEVIISLFGVKYMTSNGLAESNVVLDILVPNALQIDMEFLKKLLPGDGAAQTTHRNSIMQKLMAKDVNLIQISPSYGGEIIAVYETLSYQEDNHGRPRLFAKDSQD